RSGRDNGKDAAAHVRFAPKADKLKRASLCLLCAKTGCEQSQQRGPSFDHLVGAAKHCRPRRAGVSRSRGYPGTDHLGAAMKETLQSRHLLGLEVLVAADIVKTIAHELSVMSLGLLAGLVFVRTFLSWTLVLEIEGRWPWQREPSLMSSRAR